MAPSPATATHGADATETRGMLLGLVGVAMFSLTLPFTRLAVHDLDPGFVALGRALVAAMLAAAWLASQRARLPRREELARLAAVGAGCVIGFPWLTSIALRTVPASHGAVLVGALPLATAGFAALGGKEKPSPGFWIMALLGSVLVIGFALRAGGGSLHSADLMMLGAVCLAAMGYAEGGRLSASMGGQQVISWALVLCVPVLLPAVCWISWEHRASILAASAAAWWGFAYVSLFSMYIGFFFWYRGMAMGGVARVGQVQLLQPFLTMLGAAVLLGEQLTSAHLGFALAVIAVVAAGRKMQVRR